jgi:hypothetical protein
MTASKAVRTVATMFTILAVASAVLLSAIWRLIAIRPSPRRAPLWFIPRLAGAP